MPSRPFPNRPSLARRWLFLLLASVLLALASHQPSHAQDARAFPQTGFRVDNDVVWNYFQARGGVDTFGYPVSTLMTYQGFPVQIFQRHVLQVAGQSARPLNLLDPDIMPITQLNGSTFPGYSAAIASGAPPPSAPDYGGAVQRFLDAQVPNTWQGQSVGFMRYYLSAAPANAGSLRTLLALEVWGFPTSQPARDPSNNNFIYQRFQRGIMHYDATTGVTRGILLGDAFKSMSGGAPIVGNPPPAPPPSPAPAGGKAAVLGIEVNPGTGSRVAPQGGATDVNWVRYNGVLWHEVEASQGSRNWAALGSVERDLQALSAQGLQPVLIIRGAPAWAQKVPGALCGPIREDALDNFASFMRDLVSRYSAPPYNVKYWELGNEPDVDPALIAPTMPFGCWGNAADPYYGGGYFAQMLKQVYPAIKAADPAAQVVLGGLLLDCDPGRPPAGKDCKPGLFLEGILRNGGAAAFDIAAYHAYGLWNPGVVDADRLDTQWSHRGGVVVGKAAFIRETLARFGASKPLMMNEGGLLCHENNSACPSDDFFQAQASYLPRLYARAWANNLVGAFWFTLDGPGWRQGGLLDRNGNARPAYTALDFMGSLLAGASFGSTLSSGDLEGYAFRNGATTYHLYWSNGATRTVALPAGARAAYTHMGQPVPLSASLTVGRDPIYIQIGP